LCSAMDNWLLKINYPRTVGWLQLQEVEVAFVVVWNHSCWLHDSCTEYICPFSPSIFISIFSCGEIVPSMFGVVSTFQNNVKSEKKVSNLYFVCMLLEMCILP
jgi:hypothetical protein